MRAKFSKKTKRLVAERAGYTCSFPGCNQLTVGPAHDASKSDTTGIAAHIYSAALSGGGPRGTGNLSEQELKSVQNAIWLCAHHANLIDKRLGRDYSADTLHCYKLLHETRIAHELSGIHTPFGWVNKFSTHSSPIFRSSFEIELAKLNLIVGGNSVGKTAICEWIAGIQNPQYLERWEMLYPDILKRLSISTEFFYPNLSSIEVNFLGENYPRYKLNGELTFISPGVVKVIFPERLTLSRQGIHDDLAEIANSMKLHPYELKALFDQLGDNSNYFKGTYFEEDGENAYMHVEMQGMEGINSRLLRLLASSERERLMLELGTIAADKLSMIGPTILILDSNSWTINTDWLKRYAERFSSSTCRFQTIVSTRSTDLDLAQVSWTGWKVIRLEGEPPNVIVSVEV